RQVLHEHVRPRDETPNERAVFRVLQVGDDRFLAPVEPHEVGAVAVHHVVVAAREVSSGALDLDHARTGDGHLARGERSGDGLLDADDERAFEGKRQNIPRTSHSPMVPMIDIMSAPPSAQPNPSIFSESLNASVILRRIALMIHRVMNARSSAMPRVPIVNTVKKSHPRKKFSTPKIAATTKAPPIDFTWKPGSTTAVIQTASERMIQETMRPMVTPSERGAAASQCVFAYPRKSRRRFVPTCEVRQKKHARPRAQWRRILLLPPVRPR